MATHCYRKCFKLPELLRNALDNLTILQSLQKKGARLHIDGRYVDPDHPDDELFFNINNAISAYNRKAQLEKSKKGIQASKEKGEWVFTPRLFGYELSFKGGEPHIEIREQEAEVIRFIFTEYAKGRSIRSISIELTRKGFRGRKGDVLHPSTIRGYILKPIYMGYYKNHGAGSQRGQEKALLERHDLVKSRLYPAIVSDELWWRVNNSYRTVTRKHSRQFLYRFSAYELAGLIRCYSCQLLGIRSTFVHNYQKARHNQEHVNSNYVNRAHDKNCKHMMNTFRAETIEEVFRTCFFLIFENTNEILEVIDGRRKQYESDKAPIFRSIIRIEALITQNEKEKKRLFDAIQHGTIELTEVEDRLTKLRSDTSGLQKQKESLQREISSFELEIDSLVEDFKEERLMEFLASPPSQKRAIYLDMMAGAFVYTNHLYIHFKNGKSFIIELHEHQGKHVQTIFTIKVVFRKRLQYTILLDTKKHDFELVDTHLYRGPIDSARQIKFKESIHLHHTELIKQLKFNINELSSQV